MLKAPPLIPRTECINFDQIFKDLLLQNCQDTVVLGVNTRLLLVFTWMRRSRVRISAKAKNYYQQKLLSAEKRKEEEIEGSNLGGGKKLSIINYYELRILRIFESQHRNESSNLSGRSRFPLK